MNEAHTIIRAMGDDLTAIRADIATVLTFVDRSFGEPGPDEQAAIDRLREARQR